METNFDETPQHTRSASYSSIGLQVSFCFVINVNDDNNDYDLADDDDHDVGVDNDDDHDVDDDHDDDHESDDDDADDDDTCRIQMVVCRLEV